ncbi:MAG: CHRD domain-containing protein [Acidobacteriota bacterium]|nr:CHRD domain-containing protein [Acidobacteriota bacterium]
MRTKVFLLTIFTALLSANSEAALIQLGGFLNGANEFPANASKGTGVGNVVYDSTAHTLQIGISFSGLTGTTTASHIHCCVSPGAPTPTAGVATTTPNFAGFPLGVTSGTFFNTLDLTQASSYNPAFVTANGGSISASEAALAAGFANGTTYLNIHTSTFGGGEIRAFLQPAVPEPATSLLTIAGLAALCLLARQGATDHK